MAYRLVLLVALAITLAYLWAAWQIPLDPWSAEELVNSRTLPRVYGAAQAVTLLLLLLRPAPSAPAPRHGGRAIGMLLGAVGFVLLLPHAGLWLALVALLLASLWLMGERRPAMLAGLAAGIPLGGWLLVEVLLDVYVPGPWS